jgi:hypothetical protein
LDLPTFCASVLFQFDYRINKFIDRVTDFRTLRSRSSNKLIIFNVMPLATNLSRGIFRCYNIWEWFWYHNHESNRLFADCLFFICLLRSSPLSCILVARLTKSKLTYFMSNKLTTNSDIIFRFNFIIIHILSR